MMAEHRFMLPADSLISCSAVYFQCSCLPQQTCIMLKMTAC